MNYTAILAGRALLGKTLEPMENVCVIVGGGKIERILSRDAFVRGEYASCQQIDLGDATLLPGLIECHNHVGLDARLPDHLEMMNNCECELTVTAVKTLQDDLRSGVTTARCLGDRHYIDIHLRREIAAGRLEGPRLICAGIGMRSLHGHGYVGLPHVGEQQLRERSRENMLRGADLLKLFVTPGMPVVEGAHVPHFLTYGEIAAVVEEAASRNLPTAAHCIGGQGLHDCLKAGVDVIEHAYSVSERDIELLVQHDCWVDLTTGICLDPDREPFLSPKSAQYARETRAQVAVRIEKLIRAGVRFTLGTDANHGLLHREIEYAVQLGASRLDALRGVTGNAAIVCRTDAHSGSLIEGYDADLIACPQNPLTTPNALADICFVMKEGRIPTCAQR